MQKLYCYVDESGQDTKGQLFVAAVVIIVGTEAREPLEHTLRQLERRLKKRTDWRHTKPALKTAYLKAILKLPELKGHLNYRTFTGRQDYDQLIIQTLIQAIQTTGQPPVQVTVAIEGELNAPQKKRVTKALRTAHLRYRTVRGQRFESGALIRLADACAGFISDWERGKAYVQDAVRSPYFRDYFRQLP
jgi:hypothetical protein